jgi:hypothetical protein
MADPVAAIAAAYGAVGRELDAAHADAVVGYLAAKPQGKHGAHRYDAADWGFDADALRDQLAPYVQRFEIPFEG